MTKLRIVLVIVAAIAAAAFVLLRDSHRPAPHPPGKLRIVSLAPSVTEILFALDLGEPICRKTLRSL
jgi:ABC-type hemin transport system substrate-binding protein